MGKVRELLAAGIVRDFRFSRMDELEQYIDRLEERKAEFKVLETSERPDGIVFARIIQSYNNCPLIQLYED